MLKPEILDPQGKAVHQALPRLGYDGIAAVRALQALRAGVVAVRLSLPTPARPPDPRARVRT